MIRSEIEKYLLQALNMALQINGETSYTNSFGVKVVNDGFFFIPRLPASYVIDDELYQKIYLICNAALYPEYSLVKQTGIYFVPLDTDDIHIKRALFFPWSQGIAKRIIIQDVEKFASKLEADRIPIMDNLDISYERTNGILIAGTSGGGKSYFLTYLLTMLKHISDLLIVDPKIDMPRRWGRDNDIEVIVPNGSRSKSDFVSAVNNELGKCLELIYKRQQILYNNNSATIRHYTIVIDELLALSEGVTKSIKEAFYSLLIQISLLGRNTKVHLVLCSQRFDANAIPISCREQMNVLVQVGNINSKTIQFLFPDLDLKGIVIPQGKGTGLIQVIDSEHPFQVVPLLTPTYYTKGE